MSFFLLLSLHNPSCFCSSSWDFRNLCNKPPKTSDCDPDCTRERERTGWGEARQGGEERVRRGRRERRWGRGRKGWRVALVGGRRGQEGMVGRDSSIGGESSVARERGRKRGRGGGGEAQGREEGSHGAQEYSMTLCIRVKGFASHCQRR